MLASVVALVLRYRGDSLNIDIDAWNVNCVNEYNVRYSFCHGDAAVYRISFACTFFFFFVMLAAMCSPSFHRGYWFPKLFFFLGLLLASIWIPNNVFDNSGFALVARVVSSLFLALQAVILIEFSAQWNERWVDRAYGGDGGTALQMLPLFTPVTSLVPSEEDAIPCHAFAEPVLVTSVQLLPLSLEVQMLPLFTAAASFVPSEDEVMPYQTLAAPVLVTSVQVLPLLLEVHMLPLYMVAASLVPSLEEVI